MLSYERKDIRDPQAKDTWFKAAEFMIRKGADRELKLVTPRCKKIRNRSEAETDALRRTAEYRKVVTRGGMVEVDIAVVLTAVSISREIFDDGKTADIEAFVPEKTAWTVWNSISWTGRDDLRIRVSIR